MRNLCIFCSLFRGNISEVDSAWKISQYFKDLPYFEFALELLLYKALESSNLAELQKAISFLQSHSSFPRIVMSCARKMEISFWHNLFEIAGPAERFFDVNGDVLNYLIFKNMVLFLDMP
jgi:hypothetical protein